MTGFLQTATWGEIQSQPAIWGPWGAALPVAELRAWVAAQGVDEVWFCGAGTSAYIGDILAAGLEGERRLRSVPTTDIVARPGAFLRGARRLVVSFGRSGNSAESIGLLDALDALAPDWPRLNITCNGTSALAVRGPGRAVVLPEATHDAGFAMTSSFSTMLLTAAAVFDGRLAADQAGARFGALAAALAGRLPGYLDAALAARRPDRVVFVGSGALAFAAREAALKVMELSAGAIPALWDSTLGFRHGPKSFVTGGTDLWILASADPHARAYDDDLAAELRAQFPGCGVTLVEGVPGMGDLWSAPVQVALAQVLAVVWSASLGLAVDDPFAGKGTLTRVVSGVRLHPVRR